MTDLIRSASLADYAKVARAAGLDPIAMLRRARLPLDCLERQDIRVPVKAVRRLLEISAAASGVDNFGLRIAEASDLSNLGPVALVMRNQATIGAALESLARFIHIHNEGMRFTVKRHDGVVTITLLVRGGALRQATEASLGTTCRVIRAVCGGNWRPLEVHFMHRAPRIGGVHRQFFGCEVMFDSSFDGIVCAALDLDRKIPTAHPTLARYIESRVEALHTLREGWDAKIAEIIRSLLPGGDCSIERVAKHLSCTRRTIHRHLADCDTTFSEILDQQRADLALRLIEDHSRPLSQVAGMVGFSAQSAMARWFRARFGCSMSEWRADPRERVRSTAGRW